MKKEEISKENSRLQREVNVLTETLEHYRRQFTKVLGKNFEHEIISGWASGTDKTLSWEEIFFTLGELNADANYSIMLEEKHRLQDELNKLQPVSVEVK